MHRSLVSSGTWTRAVTLVIWLAALTSTSGGQTHGMLAGIVSDKETGDPLAGATIRVDHTPFGAISGADGGYIIRFLEPGTYSLSVSYLGYRTTIVRQVVVAPGSRHEMNVALDQSAVELGPVEIIARRPLIQKDQGTTTFSLPPEKIGTLPISTVQEIVSMQPGTTQEGNVRGGKTTATVYAVDGLSTSDLVAGGPSLTIPKSAIAGMTIHTGGVDAEFGNAQSGVVNIRTRSGTNDRTLFVRTERDSWFPGSVGKQHSEMSEVEFAASGPIVRDDLFYVTSIAVHAEDSRWWQDFEGQIASPIISEWSVFTRFDRTADQMNKSSLQLILTDRRWRDYEFSWRFNLAGLPPRRKTGAKAVLTHNWLPDPSLLVTGTASVSYLYSTIGSGPKNQVGFHPYEYDFFLRYILRGNRDWWAITSQLLLNAKADASWDAGGGHVLKAGAEVNQSMLESDVLRTEPQKTYFGKPVLDGLPLNSSYAYAYRPRTASAYVQDKVQVAGQGSILTVGVRYDVLDPTASRPQIEFVKVGANDYDQVVTGRVRASLKHQISPRVSYTAPAGENGYVFVNYGHYVQFPLFDYLYGGLHPAQIREGTRNIQAANPDLSPERTVAWELGFKHTMSEQVVGSATYFRKSMIDQIDAKTLIPFDSKSAGDYGFASYVNNAEAKAEGLEFVLSRESGHNVTGSVSYTYMVSDGISESSDENIQLAQWGFPPAKQSYPLSWDQRHTFKANAAFMIFNMIQADIVGTVHTARPYTYFPTRDGITPLDTTKVLVPNNDRMEQVVLLNMKLSYAVTTTSTLRAQIYADVRNVWNAKNVRWIDSNGRIGGELGDPSAYYDPRRVRIGIEASW